MYGTAAAVWRNIVLGYSSSSSTQQQYEGAARAAAVQQGLLLDCCRSTLLYIHTYIHIHAVLRIIRVYDMSIQQSIAYMEKYRTRVEAVTQQQLHGCYDVRDCCSTAVCYGGTCEDIFIYYHWTAVLLLYVRLVLRYLVIFFRRRQTLTWQ